MWSAEPWSGGVVSVLISHLPAQPRVGMRLVGFASWLTEDFDYD